MDAILQSPYTWVTVSFLIFVGILLKVKLPAIIGKLLDERAEKIKNQLEEARTLREEAHALLGQFQRRQRDAQKEAEDMIALSREEADIFAKEAEANLEIAMERHARIAEDKIAPAEAKAVSEVKAAASEVAINAARAVMDDQMSKAKSDPLVDGAVGELKDRLN